MIISITGTPGAGKSHLARLLEKKTGFKYLDLNKMIKQEKLYDSYDRKSKSYDVDVKKLSKFLGMLLKKYSYNPKDTAQKNNHKAFQSCTSSNHRKDKGILVLDIKDFLKKRFVKRKGNDLNNIIVDSHLSHHLISDFCIVVKCEIKILHKRLMSRKYPESKVRENVESEIFDICLEEAKNLNRDMIIVDDSR